MLADRIWFQFLLAALATWRVTHLIVREDGPWNVITRIRRAAGSGFWGELMDCFYCSSLWVSAIFAFTLRPNLANSNLEHFHVEQWILYWLSLSGLASLLERIGQQPVIVQSAAGLSAADESTAHWNTASGNIANENIVDETQGGFDHAVLRTESRPGESSSAGEGNPTGTK